MTTGDRSGVARVDAAAPAYAVIDRMVSADGWNLVAAGMAESTLQAYVYQWRRFGDWCRRTGRQYEPATIPTVISYLGHLERQVDDAGRPPSPGTIGIVLAAIRHVHRFRRDKEPDYPVPDSVALTRAFVGYCNRWVRSGHRVRQCVATSWEHLAMLESAMDRSYVRDQRNAVIILAGFFGAMRSSELANLMLPDVSFTGDGAARLYVAHSKTDRTGRGDWVHLLPYGVPELCPVSALRTWTQALAARGVTGGPLVRAVPARDARTGIGDGMHRYGVSKVTTDAASKLGFEGTWGAHSHRRGAATEAARAGLQIHDIMALGRWKSAQAALRYIEQARSVNLLAGLGPGGHGRS